ncbi:MAG: hypothetical protein WBP71_02750, partial [Terracidiphilus sp.]
ADFKSAASANFAIRACLYIMGPLDATMCLYYSLFVVCRPAPRNPVFHNLLHNGNAFYHPARAQRP